MTHRVTTVEGAIERLREWNRVNSKKWRAAFETCYAALEDRVTPEEARTAFLVAAKACGMLSDLTDER